MPHPGKCSRTGLMGLSATQSRGECPCPQQGVGARWSFRSFWTQAILWFCEYSCNSAFIIWSPNRNIITYTTQGWNSNRFPGDYPLTTGTKCDLYLQIYPVQTYQASRRNLSVKDSTQFKAAATLMLQVVSIFQLNRGFLFHIT